jgi:diguanylate cyclase (GGDEF)-like protein
MTLSRDAIWKFLASSVALVLLGSAPLVAEPAGPLRTATAVRNLSPEEARKERPVQLRAVVTYVNASAGELFVQDTSAGIFVFIRRSKSDTALKTGQLVDVSGVTAPGDFSSSVTNARIAVIGQAGMPKPVRLPFDQVSSGKQDCQWGSLVGVVRSGREENGLLYLDTIAPGGVFLTIMKEFPADWAATLIDSKVSFTGVLAAQFNEHRQVTGVRMFVPSKEFIHIDEPASRFPFALPETSAAAIGAFRLNQDGNHRIRIRAGITAVVSRTLLYVSDREIDLPVELAAVCPARLGSLVDVVGFPGIIDGRRGLQNAICRLVSDRNSVTPIELSVADIVPPQTAEEGSGLAIAKGMRNDLKLITVEGTVIQTVRQAAAQALTLISGDRTFSVTIPESAGWPADAAEPGTRVKVTGICLIAFDEYHRAQSFHLLAREAADIAVISRPSWLTLRKAVWIMVPLLLTIVAAIVWISVLRLHVAASTRELNAANLRLSQLAVEDALTGAANRRRFDERIREEMSRVGCDERPISLIMIDLDHFKQVNDLYGHQRGDQNLIQVVGALRRALIGIPDALLARYGGEEFAAILPGTTLAYALELAEEMRRSVHEMAIAHERSPFDKRQTVSLGVATLVAGRTGSDPDALMLMADRALYAAKKNGRNRAMSFGADVSADGDVAVGHSPLFGSMMQISANS